MFWVKVPSVFMLFNLETLKVNLKENIHSIGRVADNGTENTGQITRGECNRQLSSLRVFALGLCKDMLVELLNNIFESHEFHHSVRNLSAPEGH